MDNQKEHLPLARKDALIVSELEDEVLVYDLKRDKAHCLNSTAASVWKRCDGKLAVTDMTRLLKKGGELGKRLDFLIQELHREANTLGSKSAALELTNISVEMKVAIEQMREQVQNIE